MVTKEYQSYERMVKLKNPNEDNSTTTENFQEEKLDELDTDEISDILGNPFDDTSNKSPTDTLITTVTTKKGKKVTMPRSWTVSRFCSKILSHQKHAKLTSLSIIGSSGAGKTVTCKTLLHTLHTQDSSYVIKWFSRYDVLNMKKVLETMPRNRNIIIVMDDITQLQDLLSKTEQAEQSNLLYTMRHTYFSENSKVLLISLQHYQYGTLKKMAFRATNFQLNVGITGNEIANMKDIYGRYTLKNYSTIFRQSVLNGGFKYQLDGHADKSIFYEMKDFHPVLALEVNWGHLLMIEEISCNICNKDKWSAEEESPISEEDFIDMLKYPKVQLRNAFRYFSFLRTGDLMYLNPTQRKLFKHISKAYEHCDFDLKKIISLLEGDMKYNRHVRKNETKDDKQTTKQIDKVISKLEKKEEKEWLKDYTKAELPNKEDLKYQEEK